MVASNIKTRHALGVFVNHQEAEQALNALKASGFPMQQVSVVAKKVSPDTEIGGAEVGDHLGGQNVANPSNVIAEAGAIGFWGSVLVGLTSLSLPGIGAVIAAGSVGAGLISAVAGAGLGAASSRGLVKAIEELGVPEAQASRYHDHLFNGRYLTILEGSETEIQQAEQILNQQGIHDWGVFTAS